MTVPFARDPFAEEYDGPTPGANVVPHFTDREEALAGFHRLLTAPEGTILPVLHFYGVGGAGKTSLIEKLAQELADRNAVPGCMPLPYARTDFADVGLGDAVTRLTSLRSALVRDFAVPFPRFDLCLSVLVAKRGGPEEQLVRLDGWLRALCGVVETVCGTPLSSAASVAGHLFEELRTRYPHLETKVRQLGGTEEVLRLRTKTETELERELVRRFAVDLRENAPAQPGRACRAVLFMDTYERLWSEADDPALTKALVKDEWVRDLYEVLRRRGTILLVIAGRDRLRWTQLSDQWNGRLECYRLGGLSPEDTQRYLSASGVGQPPEDGPADGLQSAIIRCASAGEPENGCLPLFSGLCADIVHRHRKDHSVDPPPSWFDDIPSTDVASGLALRFLTSLPGAGDAEDLVRFLATARWFDEELLRAYREGAAYDAFRRLLGYSFVEDAGPGRLRLHAVMRKALLRTAPDKRRLLDHHRWLLQHWASRQAADPQVEVELTYHDVALRGADDMGWAGGLHRKIWALLELGSAEPAMLHAAAAMDGWRDALSRTDDLPAILCYLSTRLCRGPDRRARRAELLARARSAVDAGDRTLGRHWLTYAEAGATTDARDRVVLFREALSQAEAAGDALCQHVILRALAWCHAAGSEYVNNIGVIERALLLAQECGYKEGEVHCLCDLARAHFDGEGDAVACRAAAEEAIEVSRAAGHSQGLVRGYHNLGRALIALGEYDAATEALDAAIQAHRSYKPTTFPTPYVRRKAIACRKRGDPEAGLALIRQALECDAEMGNTEGVMLAQAELARLLEAAGRLDEARVAAREAVRLNEKHGLRHPTEGPEDLGHLL